MTDDPTTWNAGDYHQWVRPASPPCPDCECCSAALCQRAIERDSACHLEGSGSDYDLSNCPCWRKANARRLKEETGEELPASYIDPDRWATAVGERPDEPCVTVPIADPDVGTIAVIRTPDGREVYGTD